MGDLTYPFTLTAGQPENVNQLNSNLAAIKTLIEDLEAGNLADSLAAMIGVTTGSGTRRGKSIVATAQSTTATSYAVGNLTTPDRVQNIVLPTDGLIVVAYQAIWQYTVASNARAAIFIGSNQLKIASPTGVPVVQEATAQATINDDEGLSSTQGGLGVTGAGAGATTEVTTGQVISPGTASAGGPCYIFAAAGTYDVSVQFKNVAAGTLTVKNRHLWVWTLGF